MLLRSSERTSNSKALSTISRFVFRRVSFRALRISVSLMLMLVRAMKSSYTNSDRIGVFMRRINPATEGWHRPSGKIKLRLQVSLSTAWKSNRLASVKVDCNPLLRCDVFATWECDLVDLPSRHVLALRCRPSAKKATLSGTSDENDVSERSARIQGQSHPYRGSQKLKTTPVETRKFFCDCGSAPATAKRVKR